MRGSHQKRSSALKSRSHKQFRRVLRQRLAHYRGCSPRDVHRGMSDQFIEVIDLSDACGHSCPAAGHQKRGSRGPGPNDVMIH